VSKFENQIIALFLEKLLKFDRRMGLKKCHKSATASGNRPKITEISSN
jgi:hypothetical protein